MGIEREGMNLKFVGGNSDEQSTGGASKFRKKSTETHCSSFLHGLVLLLLLLLALRRLIFYVPCILDSHPFIFHAEGKLGENLFSPVLILISILVF